MSHSRIVSVVGLRRYGKSTHVLMRSRAARRVVLYDTVNDDYAEGIVCRTWADLVTVWRLSYRGPFRLTYKPSDPFEHFADFCKLAYECGDCLVAIEEVQLFFQGAFCDPAFTKLITAGGHTGVDLIGVTQAPKKLGELLRSQAMEWSIFGLREDTHIKYVVERCPGVSADLIRSLPPRQYLLYRDGEPCYWLCSDDPANNRTKRERLEYVGGENGRHAATGGDADSCREVGCGPKDGSADVPFPQSA